MIFPQTLISFVPMFHESANKVTIHSYAKHSQDMGSGETNSQEYNTKGNINNTLELDRDRVSLSKPMNYLRSLKLDYPSINVY